MGGNKPFSAIDSTKIAVEFNKPVTKGAGFYSAENLSNYYIGIGDEDVQKSSIAANNSNKYQAKVQADGKTVVISGVAATSVIWEDKNTESVFSSAQVALVVKGTDTVVKNKDVTIQVRNVKDTDGNLMSTQEETFKSVDKEAATIYGTKAIYDTDGDLENITKTDNNITEVVVTSNKDVYFVFDEPIFDNGTVKYYIGSRDITADVKTAITDITDANEIKNGTLVKIEAAAGIEDLKLGNHTFRIVGLEDLAGNKPAGDIYNAVIKVVEPGEEVETPDVAPAVQSIKQISEGEFKITFASTPADETKIVLKDSNGNTVDSKAYSDLTTDDIYEFADNITDYNGATKLRYTIDITGADGGKIVGTNDKKADKYSRVHEFELDLTAPEVVFSTKDAEGKVIATNFVSTDKKEIHIP